MNLYVIIQLKLEDTIEHMLMPEGLKHEWAFKIEKDAIQSKLSDFLAVSSVFALNLFVFELLWN